MALLATPAACLLTGGCNVQPSVPSPPPTVPVPALTATPDTIITQDRGGLSVSVVPVTFTLSQQTQVAVAETGRCVRTTPPSGPDGLPMQTPVRTMQRTTTPVAVVTPDRLAFAVTITNRLPHVFRVQGALVQVMVGGQPSSDADCGQLVAAVVPPGGQQQVTVFGPPVASVPPGSTVGLSAFDLVTETDAAGNPTERQTMAWSFAVGVQNQPVPAMPGPTVESYDEPIGPSLIVVPSPGGPPPNGQQQGGGGRRPNKANGPTSRKAKPAPNP